MESICKALPICDLELGENVKRPLIYNLEVALFCPRCRRELVFGNPYENTSNMDIPQKVLDSILQAHVDHLKEGECFESIRPSE